jgi:phosphopantothenoylcysteine decarboxylase / phosphopantothenate---cysteine ligase
MGLAGKKIVVGVGGGIAAFKAVVLVRELQRRGADVRVVMTPSALRFIGAATFTGLTGKPAVTDLWDPSYPGEVHVELGSDADAIVVAPATANLLARAASGMADDALLATLSCAGCPVLFAPAMHENMWLAAATQRNARQLEQDGAVLVGPVAGALASGEQGMGRMAEPEAIADAVERVLAPRSDLAGKRVLISAGPTLEDIDPVRYISNRSSGRMGFALATTALERGAQVTLVCGPTSGKPPAGVELVAVRSAREMLAAIMERQAGVDVVVMNAAVADYRPAEAATAKIKKSQERMTVELVKNPDILAELGAGRQGKRPLLIGFAMETNDLARYARKKLVDKRCDLIVANEATVAGSDETQVILVGHDGDVPLPPMTKTELADKIWDRVLLLS